MVAQTDHSRSIINCPQTPLYSTVSTVLRFDGSYQHSSIKRYCSLYSLLNSSKIKVKLFETGRQTLGNGQYRRTAI